MQKILDTSQLSKFYHNEFVEDQVRDFKSFFMATNNSIAGVIADVGGGCGYFASAVRHDLGNLVRVIEMDPVGVENSRKCGLEAEIGDATNYDPKGDEAVVCFNLILRT